MLDFKWKIIVKNRYINNSRFRGHFLNFIWNGVIVTSTIGGFWFSADLIKNFFWKPKKRIFDMYDNDVIDKTNKYMKDSIKKGIELDYEETLNKLQELKNLGKKD